MHIQYLNYGKCTIVSYTKLSASKNHRKEPEVCLDLSHTCVLLWLGWVRVKLQSLSEVTVAALQSGRIWLESSRTSAGESSSHGLYAETQHFGRLQVWALYTPAVQNAYLSLNPNCLRHTERIHQQLVHDVSDILMLLRKMHCIVRLIK